MSEKEMLITEVSDNVDGRGASVKPIEECELGVPIVEAPESDDQEKKENS